MNVLQRLLSGAFVKFVEAVKLRGPGESGELLARELYRRVPGEYRNQFEYIFQEDGDDSHNGGLQHNSSRDKMLGDLPKGKVKILREILEENGDWEKLVPDEKLWKEVNRMKGSKSPFIELLNALVDEGCTVERFEEHMRNNLSPGVFPEVCRAVDGNDMVKTRRGTSEQCTPHAQEEASAEVQTESQCLPFFRAPELESLTTRKQRRLENRNIQLQIDFPGFQNGDKSGIFRQTTDSRVNSSVFARLRGAKRNAAHPGSHIRGYPTKKRPGMEAEMARDETDACRCGNREAASCGSTTPASLDYCYHELVYLEDTLDNEERDHLHHIVDNDNYEDYDHTEFCVVICDLET